MVRIVANLQLSDMRYFSGKVYLLRDTIVCKPGEELSPEQCKILELFDVKQSTFRLHLLALWSQDEESDQGFQFKELKQVPEIQMATALAGKRERPKGLSESRAAARAAADGPIDITHGMPVDDEDDSEFD